MYKRNEEKGITLITLGITIVVLIILASVTIYAGLDTIRTSRVTVFATEMKIMQTQINRIRTENKSPEELGGEKIDKNTNIELYNKLSARINEVTSYGYGNTEEDKSGYRFYTVEQLKNNLGIDGVEQSVFVNFNKRKVISLDGVQYEGKVVYVLEQVPNNLYNVDQEKYNGNTTFELISEMIADNTWQITVTNIKNDWNIDKWEIEYQLEGKDWKRAYQNTFEVTTEGRYNVRIRNEDIVAENSILIEKPYYFRATTDETKVEMENGEATVTINLFNYEDNTKYSPMDLKYEVSLQNNDKYYAEVVGSSTGTLQGRK